MHAGNLVYLLLLITWSAVNAQSCNDGGKIRAPFSCREYDECINGELVRKKCGLGKYFDGQQCGYLWKVKCTVDNCEEDRKYPRGVCKHNYDYCKHGKVTKQNCPENSVFDGQHCITLEMCTMGKEIKKETKLTNKAAMAETDIQCNEGRTINHPTDCTMYKLCENGQWVDKSCSLWQHYDSVTNECKLWSYTCRYDGLCTENETRNVFGSCSEYMKCLKGSWEKMHCSDGTSFLDGSCKHTPCPLRPVPNKCSNFMEPGSDKQYECPSQQLFDNIERQCIASQNARCFEGECINEDTSFVADDCSKYKLCENDKWVEKSCLWLSYYDVVTKGCKYRNYICGDEQTPTTIIPDSKTSEKQTCDKENKKRSVRDDCKHFQICRNGEWIDDKCYVWGKFDINENECFYFKMWAVNCA